jgi:CDP-paratose 2-epimerase
MLAVIRICEKHTGKPLNYQIVEQKRKSDHIWWVSDVSKFQTHFPNWKYLYNLNMNINDKFQEWGNLTEKFQQE